ncbi:MAG: AMP-binding protein [Rhizobiales bacterium]|nr:AMP-binding protein [Hyphomicrobiales bacterium]
MRLSGATYEDVVAGFRWDLPARFNIADAICHRHAEGAGRDDPALIVERADGALETYTFQDVSVLSRRLANALAGHGVGAGDVVAVQLPQAPETLIAHVAIQTLGAIALPISLLFGPDAVQHRLTDSRARAIVTTAAGWERIADACGGVETLGQVVLIDGGGLEPGGNRPGILGFWPLIERASPTRASVPTGIDAPALLMYTSGTTGNPKGVLHAQRVLLGHLPGVALPHEMAPRKGDRFWTPADWAWAGGLLNILFPALYWGLPVHCGRAEKFDPEAAFAFLSRHAIANSFLPPTALRLMRQVERPRERHAFALRSIGSGGESLGEDMVGWGRETFGVTINEFYGQTEVNLVLGNCAGLFPVRAGSMGRPIPGHRVAVVDPEGEPVADGHEGVVAVARPDPVMFLEYWGNPEATQAKFRGHWCLLGDVATRDPEGYFWFKGRDDDIINSAGYRIGPSEVEDCLMRHPAVKLAGVVGVPDAIRGEAVAAFIVPAEGVVGTDALAVEIQQFVRERLAGHEYPRHIRFIAEMPMTVTGKIRRRDLRGRL